MNFGDAAKFHCALFCVELTSPHSYVPYRRLQPSGSCSTLRPSMIQVMFAKICIRFRVRLLHLRPTGLVWVFAPSAFGFFRKVSTMKIGTPVLDVIILIACHKNITHNERDHRHPCLVHVLRQRLSSGTPWRSGGKSMFNLCVCPPLSFSAYSFLSLGLLVYLFAPQVLSYVTSTDAADREDREWNDKITIARRLANLATATLISKVSKFTCVSFVPPAVNQVSMLT